MSNNSDFTQTFPLIYRTSNGSASYVTTGRKTTWTPA